MLRSALLALAVVVSVLSPAAAQNFYSTPKQATGLTNTAVTIKASAGALTWFSCWNPSDAVAYVQVFDTAGAVVVGTTPAVAALPVPTMTTFGMPLGINMFSGIKVAATTAPGGGTAPSAVLNCVFGFQ